MIGIYSKGIAEIPFLESFLDDEVVFSPKEIKYLKYIAGWGLKSSAQKAISIAKKNRIPYLALEDGFIRSLDLGVHRAPTFSMVVDPIGIYYDAARPSLLENILNDDSSLTQNILDEAEEAIEFIRKHQISKYNLSSSNYTVKSGGKKNILLVDQTANDMSIVLGGANASSFRDMVKYAQGMLDDANVYVKYHPDVIAGKKKGYLSELPLDPRFKVIKEHVNPIALLESMDHVLVVTSQLGYEALLANKKVTTFGMPFYACWGVTEDRIACGRRKARRSVEEIFAAAYIVYTRYIRPRTGAAGRIMDVLHYISLEKQGLTSPTRYYAVNIPYWKRRYIRPFIPGVEFISSSKKTSELQKDSRAVFVAWSYQSESMLNDIGKERRVRVEDGFYRSVGLGSNFFLPWSIVMDRRGMYFNPTTESDLEYILNHQQFDELDLEEAYKIRELIVANGLTKYNVDSARMIDLPNVKGRKVIFVPGQVQDDASILLGCQGEFNSIDKLLKHVRQTNPDAFILFKPHPDVVSGNRTGASMISGLRTYCDHIETRASVVDCIQAADEVHTLTSQAGFDALLRGKKVFTYGMPFYAGWGLTEDALTFERRKRKLGIDELVAGVLLYYPLYYNHELKQPASCRAVLRKLARIKNGSARSKYKNLYHSSRLRVFRKFKHAVCEFMGAD